MPDFKTPTTDTFNRFGIAGSTTGGAVAMLMPPKPGQKIEKAHAINLAAYLLIMTGAEPHELTTMIDAILKA